MFQIKVTEKMKIFPFKLRYFFFFKIVSFTDKCENDGSFEMSMNDIRSNWRKEIRYTSVSIVTRPRVERAGGLNPVSDNIFSSPYRPQSFWDLPTRLFYGYEGCSP